MDEPYAKNTFDKEYSETYELLNSVISRNTFHRLTLWNPQLVQNNEMFTK